MTSLAVIVVSHNSAGWLPACLTSIVERSGDGSNSISWSSTPGRRRDVGVEREYAPSLV